MGTSKANILMEGQPIVKRIADELTLVGFEVVVLGAGLVENYAHVEDVSPLAGPLDALRNVEASHDLIFVISCDIPFFRGQIALAFEGLLGNSDVVLPEIAGRLQPLCALYRRSAFSVLRDHPEWVRVFEWVNSLNARMVSELELSELGIMAHWLLGANTPEELQKLIDQNP